MSTWITVYESGILIRLEIVKDVLENAGLEVVRIDKKDSALLIGTYELKVRQEHAFRAVNIIKNEIKFETI